jgi:hypothetical protein
MRQGSPLLIPDLVSHSSRTGLLNRIELNCFLFGGNVYICVLASLDASAVEGFVFCLSCFSVYLACSCCDFCAKFGNFLLQRTGFFTSHLVLECVWNDMKCLSDTLSGCHQTRSSPKNPSGFFFVRMTWSLSLVGW